MYKNVQELNYSFDGEYLYDSYRNRIASIEDKPLEGLPLLVIEDEVDSIVESEFKIKHPSDETHWKKALWKDGYATAKETYKFTEDDLGKLIEICIDVQESGKLINHVDVVKKFNQSLTKKELLIEVETELDAYYRNGVGGGGKFPKIINNQIKAVWK